MGKTGSAAAHRWRFFRAGGLDQVLFVRGEDLAHLGELDRKLWVALSCPTRGVEFDPRTLDLIDADRDGRIRADDLLAAVQWTVAHLEDPGDLLRGESALPLAAIREVPQGGASLRAAARRILANLGKPDAAAITLEDAADKSRIFGAARFNGDGVVPAEAAEDEATRRAIEAIIACLGGEPDRSGRPGVTRAKLDAFFAAAQAYSAWRAAAESDPSILPLGPATPEAAAAIEAVRAKVEDFFARCSVAAFDPRAVGVLNRAEGDYAALAAKDLAVDSEDLAGLPLARVAPDAALRLEGALNPAWSARVERFRAAVVAPLHGPEKAELAHSEWRAVLATFALYEAWLKSKAGGEVERLGLETVRWILSSDVRERIASLIEQDAALAEETARIEEVERLVRFRRDLGRLCRNFVNFSDFYDPRTRAIFQVGCLYMDGRTTDLCLEVSDIERHVQSADMGRIFLAYCQLTRQGVPEKRHICAAFTSGGAGALYVGRNGVFYDRQGREWDATIVRVAEHQISLKEAFWAPWKKVSAMIGEQLKKLMAAKESAALAAAAKRVDETGKTFEAGRPPAAARPDGAALASSVAAIGIAVGLLGSAAAGLVGIIAGLPLHRTLLGVAGVLLAVSAPSVILAYFRLRVRDVAPLLNACGWAVNGRIRLTLPLGRRLTRAAHLPKGAHRQRRDPYAESRWRGRLALALIVVALLLYGAWRLDFLDPYLPERLQHRAPAAETTIPAAGPESPAPGGS